MSALPPTQASALTFEELRALDQRNALAEVELVFGPSDRWSADEWERRGIDDLEGLLCNSTSFHLGPAPSDVLIFTSPCTPDREEGLRPFDPLNLEEIAKRQPLVSRPDALPKITDNVPPPQKSPTRQPEKSPTRQSGKSPADRVPVDLWVCPPDYLKSLLLKHGQQEWTTDVRLSGLLILQDFIIRQFKSKRSKDRRGRRIRISADLAHSYSSSIKRPKAPSTILEPLAVLEAIGALEKVENARFGGPVTCSSAFVVPAPFLKTVENTEVHLTPYVARKRETAYQRREARLNRRYCWRHSLSLDLAKVGLDPEGLRKAA